MFHFETIDATTHDLLVKLQSSPAFSELRLVGRTALALQLGHRKSIDLDLFGSLSADEFAITEQLNKIGKITLLKKSSNIYIYILNGIKVDIVNYPYKWLESPVKDSNIIVASTKDIAAMKLAAINGRGTKKDFIDLYFLLKILDIKKILDLYTQKYPEGSEFLVLKSLSYFDDADLDEDPVMLKPEKWENIKTAIKEYVHSFLQKRTN